LESQPKTGQEPTSVLATKLPSMRLPSTGMSN
jgi:hypothetical protein